MTDCHHKDCCSCDRLAVIVVEVAGPDGLTRFDLCDPHYVMVVQEAARKNVVVVMMSDAD
jgi:hypothetical protein